MNSHVWTVRIDLEKVFEVDSSICTYIVADRLVREIKKHLPDPGEVSVEFKSLKYRGCGVHRRYSLIFKLTPSSIQ